MPYATNGTWIPYQHCLNYINGTTDPVSGFVTSANCGDPILWPILLGFLYIFLWIRFANSPSRFKIVGMAALVLVISVVMAAAGLTTDAVLQFIAFIVAFFVSLLFKQ